MSTPGRRKALRALAGRRRKNRDRVAAGKKPILKGRAVSLATFNKRTGAGLTKKKARERRNKK